MKKFVFTNSSLTHTCKLPDQWILFELLKQHSFQKKLKDFADNPIPKTGDETANKIIKLTKKLLKRDIKSEEFENFYKELKDHFFHEEASLHNSILPYLMTNYLGPLGFSTTRFLFNLDDFTEVHIQGPDRKMMGRKYAYGFIKSETCGWIGWMLVTGDKALHKIQTSDYVWLTTHNHFKLETAKTDLFTKSAKYNNEVFGRGLKRFFITTRFWFHDDLQKLYRDLHPVFLDDYSEIVGSFYID